jgi:hypothetical protein
MVRRRSRQGRTELRELDGETAHGVSEIAALPCVEDALCGDGEVSGGLDDSVGLIRVRHAAILSPPGA